MSIPGFLNRFFSKEQNLSSKDVAKERLRLVLIHDRSASLPDSVMLALREDLISVISKYMEIDQAALEVGLTKSDDEVTLIANIPILQIKRAV